LVFGAGIAVASDACRRFGGGARFHPTLGGSRAGHRHRRLAAYRPRGDRVSGARRSGCCGARCRDAGHRRHYGAAAASEKEARTCGYHGFDADSKECRGHDARLVAWRRRLHSEAGCAGCGHERGLPPGPDYQISRTRCAHAPEASPACRAAAGVCACAQGAHGPGRGATAVCAEVRFGCDTSRDC